MLKISLAHFRPILSVLGLAMAVVGVSGVAIAPVQAQATSDVDPLGDFQTQDSGTDIFGENGQRGLQDLLHQINLLNNMSMDEFVIQRQDNITSEADRFRQLQRDRIGTIEVDSTDIDADGDVDSTPEL